MRSYDYFILRGILLSIPGYHHFDSTSFGVSVKARVDLVVFNYLFNFAI